MPLEVQTERAHAEMKAGLAEMKAGAQTARDPPSTLGQMHTPRTKAKIPLRPRTNSEADSTIASRTSDGNDFVVEPMTPAEAIRTQGSELNDHEKGEILDYPKVYYLGKRHCKQQPDLHARNRGFDDDKGEYHVHVGDHLGFRYEILSPLGKGSFGQVLKCLDHKTGSICAVKIVKNKRRFQAQALVEIKILRQLRDNDPHRESSVIHLKDNFFFRNHHCIVFPLHSLNLYDYMKSTNFEPMPMSLIRNLAVQILKCLRYLRTQRIVHCDMKPENILLLANSKSKISVIDFGSACLEDERVYTYIQSRFYRSPEVILGLPYGFPIDMWSFGCILAELFTSYPLFPGENEMDQMACIMEIKGLPPDSMIMSAPRAKMFFGSDGQPYIVENSRGKKRYPGNKSLAQALKCRDRDFIDFLSKCLEWEPHNRMNAEEALSHRWITGSSLVSNSVGKVSAPLDNSSPASKQRHKKGSKKDIGQKKMRQQETFPPINLI